jgi:dTDP-glucose 4,6-dehydratase
VKILITGGCGFIGSNFIRYILRNHPEYNLINLDALTYAGNLENLRDIEGDDRYTFIKGRIEDQRLVREIINEVDSVVHFAAESHVDRSIMNVQPFIETNIIGTTNLLEAIRDSSVKRYIHISTDEVYGSLGESGRFTEETPLAPNSPYAASKASADLIVRAYYETYDIPAIIVRPSNNYGPYQFPEKFIPLMITNIIEDRPIPLYGEGRNVRDWLFVEDNCRAIDLILHNGRIGEVYNVGGNSEKRNIDIARAVLRIMGKGEEMITFVKDRPGHDYRYALDSSKLERETGWRPSTEISEGLKRTVDWYRENEWWWRPLKDRLIRESRGFWER